MRLKTRYGFIGTSGLVVMIGAGTFFTVYACDILYRFARGMTFEQSLRMFLVLFLGGILPYAGGWMMFRHGKKILVIKGEK